MYMLEWNEVYHTKMFWFRKLLNKLSWNQAYTDTKYEYRKEEV